ncbi:thiamine-phosphate kinase [Oscillatoria sp. CS-180]|uniref:thiamine-phosphate kinase n=1 Tax=Oscillatoria sp. CS-180 TaxID=3021720 RepID=UPI00232B5605|nr:thiamine-phosphate kinase [Oscillatoria sp. CS-180]MDB9527086.1 thiamine-phosphate kinase [Oscillatoria sp. CS-180]
MDQPTVADIGELGLLKRLQHFCAKGSLDNDAAVLPEADTAHVVTTDLLVEGVHFSDRTTAPEDVGWRAIAANLSDLAAMGAMPIGVTVGLSVPRTIAVDWIERVYQGMSACLSAYGGEILGGDVVQSSQVMLAITAIGQVAPRRVIRRDRAQPGHVIVATGEHGASRAGLELLLHPQKGQQVPNQTKQSFIQAHQRPIPRLDWGHQMNTLPDSDFETIAGMDSSDGLANAVLYLCQASGVGARLVRSRLPLPPALADWVGEQTALDWCLYGGEDFELVLCLPSKLAHALIASMGSSAIIIGTVVADLEILLLDSPEETTGLALTWESCFRHF